MPKQSYEVVKKYSTPTFGEVGKQINLLVNFLKDVPMMNPDDLVSKKGIIIYKKMRLDDQIKATLTLKKFARLATNWEIQPASEDANDVEMAKFVENQFRNLQGTFEDVLYNIYSALDFGFSVTEKVFQIVPKGEWAGMNGLKALKTKDPENYEFIVDEYGNLLPAGIKFTGDFKAVTPYPSDKFIIYSYNKEFSNWYGNSDLRAAYRSWWSKELIIRFYNLYLERFGMPTAVGKYKPGTDKTEVDKLLDILDNLQAKYAITVPDTVNLEFLESTGKGDAGYQNAINLHNTMISRAILVPDLVGFNETGGGSYALGKKHFDAFLWILKKLGRDTEETIVGEQIIKPLIDMNYDDVTDYPKFRFQNLTEEDTEAKSRVVRLGVDGGFINPQEKWVRPYLNLPRNDEGLPLGIDLTQAQAPEGYPAGKPRAEAPVADNPSKKGGQTDAWVPTNPKGNKYSYYTVENEGQQRTCFSGDDIRRIVSEIKAEKGEDAIVNIYGHN